MSWLIGVIISIVILSIVKVDKVDAEETAEVYRPVRIKVRVSGIVEDKVQEDEEELSLEDVSLEELKERFKSRHHTVSKSPNKFIPEGYNIVEVRSARLFSFPAV